MYQRNNKRRWRYHLPFSSRRLKSLEDHHNHNLDPLFSLSLFSFPFFFSHFLFFSPLFPLFHHFLHSLFFFSIMFSLVAGQKVVFYFYFFWLLNDWRKILVYFFYISFICTLLILG